MAVKKKATVKADEKHPVVLKHTVGTKVKVTGYNGSRDSGYEGRSGVIIATYLKGSGLSSYPYTVKLDNGQGNCGLFENELQEAIMVKAYAYKQGTEFHWFNTEKARKGYERFPTHDLEKAV